jgi:monoamine oxidase
MSKIFDFIIVGGGIAGTTLANNLKTPNYLLLESTNRLGGRIFSKKVGNNIIEYGAKWIHGDVPNFPKEKLEYIIEKNINDMQKFKIVDVNISEKSIYSILDKYRRATYSNRKRFCDSLEMSWEEKKIIDNIFAEDFGEHICEISQSNKNFKIYDGYNKRITNGYGNIIQKPENYKLNSRVKNIKKYINLWEVSTKEQSYLCKNIVLAVPLNIVKNRFSSILSERKLAILNKLEMGKINILVLFFDKIFWDKETTFWFSRKYPNIVIVNGLNNVLYMKEFSTQKMNKKNYLKYLSHFFPKYKLPTNIIVQNWNKHKDIQGSWTYHKQNITTKELVELSEPENNIGLIGEYISTNRWGTTDGAYISAIKYSKLHQQ